MDWPDRTIHEYVPLPFRWWGDVRRRVVVYRGRLKWYELGSDAGAFAEANGLADAQWFRPNVPRARLRELMSRTDYPALRDTAIWLGLALLCATLAVVLWPSWWCAPFLLAYGVLYASASDSRWHESGHGTAFRTGWIDESVHQIACFATMRNPTVWRWQHARHHSDTLIVGRDPEIDVMRPARLAKLVLNFAALWDGPIQLFDIARHGVGWLNAGEREVIPDAERHKVARVARVWLAIYAVTIATAVLTHSWLPVLLVGAPRFYGCFMAVVYSLTQHAGLGENVLDHRLNSRTVLMNPVNRFLYWNMGYHIEHHMFPLVPYHRLPALHEEVRGELPAPYPSILAAYREIIPAILRQLRDPTYFIARELPAGAPPYQGPLEGLLPALVTSP
jgi:fatty acid desaturase